MALLHFWRSNREIVLGQTIQQVMSNAGDGSLRDGNLACSEFREYLTLAPIESLFAYLRQCLETPFSNSGAVLQDLVNELGRRLDFNVDNGFYRGRRNAIGFDGIWRYSDEPEIVVEVKTTDAYTFPLETTNEYRKALANQRQINQSASILIVVGREDTGALEAQVRGSRFAWDIRLISVESLIKLAQVRTKSDDPATVRQIHQVLRPFEYTKVDKIIEILFATATDVDSQQEEGQLEFHEAGSQNGSGDSPAQDKTDRALVDEMKERAIKAFSELKGVELVRQSRSYFWSADKQVRACCTVSKQYHNAYQPYWYAYHPKWDNFLQEGDGYLIFACMDLDSAFAVPQKWFFENTRDLNTSERNDRLAYWHVPFTTLEDGGLAINLSKAGRKHSLEPYRFPLRPSRA